MIRFLHTSDLHLGKPFGRFPEAVRHRLRQARHDAIARLAAAARDGGAAVVLVAGDSFDATTPAPATLRQALNAMASAADLTWVLLPGNHDSLAAAELWRRMAADRPPNVLLALEPAPLWPAAFGGAAAVLPAPCTTRSPGRDLTEWMDTAETGQALRIGLAHGAVRDFAEREAGAAAPAVLAPDRATRARLSYLALGDWHGCQRIGPETWYSGTPERDSFKHTDAASALLVSLDGGRAEATRVSTGAIGWRDALLDLREDDDPATRLAALVPPLGDRALTLLRLTIRGQTGLSARGALASGLDRIAPDFLWFDANLDGLDLIGEAADLDRIDRAGALRQAAEALLSESTDDTLSDGARRAARGALARLFSYAAEGA